MRKYQAPSDNFFRLPNNIFDLGLTPIQFAIYAYLVSCAGNKGYCWPSMDRIAIELSTGLRRGELLGLKWQDIDWKNGIIKIRCSIARVDGQIVEAPLKTKNSYRAVTISRQAIEVLKQQKAKTNDQYIFPSPNGGPISPDSVNNMLKRVLARAGIPKVRFHNLRHTFATIALQNGVDIKTLSSMLGHFSPGFTLDTYTHVTTTAQKEAAETIGNILNA